MTSALLQGHFWLPRCKNVQDIERYKLEESCDFGMCQCVLYIPEEKKTPFCFSPYTLLLIVLSLLVDSDILPRNCLWDRLHAQLLHLGGALIRSRPLHDHAGPAVHVVRNLFPSHLCWLLLWLSEAALRAPCQNQPDTKTDPRPSVVSSSLLCVSLCIQLLN